MRRGGENMNMSRETRNLLEEQVQLLLKEISNNRYEIDDVNKLASAIKTLIDALPEVENCGTKL